jgi:hypothetical protein
MRLLQLFYTSRRPLNLLGHQCLRVIDTSYRCPCLFSEYVHHQNCHLPLSNTPEGTAVIYISIQLQLLSYIFELHDMSMGHARLVCIQILFSLPRERFGSHSFPSPSDRIALAVLINTLHYNGTLSRRNIDVFRLYVCS